MWKNSQGIGANSLKRKDASNEFYLARFGVAVFTIVTAWAVSWLIWLLLGRLRQRMTNRTKTQLDDVIVHPCGNWS